MCSLVTVDGCLSVYTVILFILALPGHGGKPLLLQQTGLL